MSESATPATEAPAGEQPVTTDPTPTPAPADTAGEKDWKAEAEKWKALSRKHEDSAKANADKAKRFDEFEESQKTEQQKLADAAEKARFEAKSAAAELAVMKAAVKHGLSQDDLDLLGTHGTSEEIDARAERLATRLKSAEANKPRPDFGAGDRGSDVGSSNGQLTAQDMKRMTSAQIDEAHEKGLFRDLLGGK